MKKTLELTTAAIVLLKTLENLPDPNPGYASIFKHIEHTHERLSYEIKTHTSYIETLNAKVKLLRDELEKLNDSLSKIEARLTDLQSAAVTNDHQLNFLKERLKSFIDLLNSN